MPKGLKNIYQCPNGHILITIDTDEGTTPFMTMCPSCGERSTSRVYRVPQDLIPTHEWYKAKIKKNMSEWTKDHIERGGLILRPIKKEFQEWNKKNEC